MDKKSKRRKEESWDREANRLAERRNRFIEKENEKKNGQNLLNRQKKI